MRAIAHTERRRRPANRAGCSGNREQFRHSPPHLCVCVCASMRRRAGRPRINPSVLPTELEAMRRSIPSVRRRSNVICERQPMGAHTRAQTRQKVAPQMQSSHSVHDFVHGVFDARLTDQSNLAQLKRAKGHRDYLRERIGKLCSTRLTVAHTSDCRLLIGRKKTGWVGGWGGAERTLLRSGEIMTVRRAERQSANPRNYTSTMRRLRSSREWLPISQLKFGEVIGSSAPDRARQSPTQMGTSSRLCVCVCAAKNHNFALFERALTRACGSRYKSIRP